MTDECILRSSIRGSGMKKTNPPTPSNDGAHPTVDESSCGPAVQLGAVFRRREATGDAPCSKAVDWGGVEGGGITLRAWGRSGCQRALVGGFRGPPRNPESRKRNGKATRQHGGRRHRSWPLRLPLSGALLAEGGRLVDESVWTACRMCQRPVVCAQQRDYAFEIAAGPCLSSSRLLVHVARSSAWLANTHDYVRRMTSAQRPGGGLLQWTRRRAQSTKRTSR